MPTKYTKCPQNISNCHKLYQHLLLQNPMYKIYPNWDFLVWKWTIWQSRWARIFLQKRGNFFSSSTAQAMSQVGVTSQQVVHWW
jgi:hypothetical protein